MAEILSSTLRTIGEQVGAKAMQQLAHEPGVKALYRLTIRYHDRRAADSVATLRWTNEATLGVVYRGLFAHKPVITVIERARYEAFAQELNRLGFDRLNDQPNIPSHGVDLWLLERASGSFYNSVVLAPELTGNVYARLVFEMQRLLPEMTRPISDPTPKRRSL
jgi:hypothetical protein